MFEPTVYIQRRRALVEALAARGVGDGLVLFPGNRESPMNYADNAYRFRQDSSFLYYFGLAEPDLAAALDPGSGKATLYADELSVDDLVWTGPRPTAAELATACGADEVRPRADFGKAAAGAGAGALFMPPYRMDTALELAEALGMGPREVAGRASAALVAAVVAMREIKEGREVEDITRAVDVSIDMHRAVIAAARPGATERGLMAEAYRAALAGGGMPSFPPIATTRGAVLHNHAYDRTLEAGGLFLLDAGAETVRGYAGDLTSTFPIGRTYDGRQKTVYSIVLEAGKAAVRTIRPGVPYREAHFAAARTIAAGLKDLGLMRGDMEAAVAAGAHALFFPHGIGHQMGLDVHDMESLGEVNVGYDGQPKSTLFGLKSLRMAKPVKPGMVLTVEPGVYFIPGLAAIWKAERRFNEFIDYDRVESWLDVGGFRNEENWLVTDDGARRLGKPFDKSIAAMEGYRAAGL